MTWTVNSFRITLIVVGVFLPSLAARADDSIDFNRDIRPILSENCFYCHGRMGISAKPICSFTSVRKRSSPARSFLMMPPRVR